MARFVKASGANLFEGSGPTPGPVQYMNIPIDNHVLACVQRGLYLVIDGRDRFAIYVRGPNEMGFPQKLQIEVLASTKEAAERLLGELRRTMRVKNIYRGRVLSFARDERGGLKVNFHSIPKMPPH